MEKINKKVLVAEDDLDFLSLLCKIFSSSGFDVVYAKDGEEALSVIEKEKPDLIILDILMPKIGGIEVAKKLKESDDKTPLMFLTNLKDMTHIASAMESSRPNSDYIVKSEMRLEDIVTRAKNKLGIK